jgi:hypothetical protein
MCAEKGAVMPFNSNSYYRNKYQRQAKAYLAKARAIKAAPDPIREKYFPGSNAADILFNVKMARSQWQLYLIQRRICELS